MKNKPENYLDIAFIQLEKAIITYKKCSGILSINDKLSILRQIKKIGGQAIELGDELLKDL